MLHRMHGLTDDFSRVKSLIFFSGLLLAGCLSISHLFNLSALVAQEKPAIDLPPPAEKQIDFDADIRPIFLAKCTECHCSATKENGLRLDRGPDALRGSDNGSVILPTKSAESLLVHLVAGVDPEKIMPPEGDRLSSEQIGLI
ncbi:MAG: c-type cytochrome domain-containing protein, partial [Planctomycetaceae bacterium]